MAEYRAAWEVDAPEPGAIGQFTVKSIEYDQGGSHRSAKGAQPFVTMELKVTRWTRRTSGFGALF